MHCGPLIDAWRRGGCSRFRLWQTLLTLTIPSPYSAATDRAGACMGLSPTAKKFILHWGEMASRWGVNRTVAQIHALLFVSPEPLNAEQLTELLSVSRSNVSTSLRELQGWGVVRVVHVMGDRRDHFECVSEIWDMFQAILDERKRRVIDPAIDVLRECVIEADKAGSGERYAKERLTELL